MTSKLSDFNKDNMSDVIKGFEELANPKKDKAGIEKTDTRRSKLLIMGHSWARGWGRHSESMGAAVQATIDNLELFKQSPGRLKDLQSYVLTIQNKINEGKIHTFIKRTFAFKTTIKKEQEEFTKKIDDLKTKLAELNTKNNLATECRTYINNSSSYSPSEKTMFKEHVNFLLYNPDASRLGVDLPGFDKLKCILLYPEEKAVKEVKEDFTKNRGMFIYGDSAIFQNAKGMAFIRLVAETKELNTMFEEAETKCRDVIPQKLTNTDQQTVFLQLCADLKKRFLEPKGGKDEKKDLIKLMEILRRVPGSSGDDDLDKLKKLIIVQSPDPQKPLNFPYLFHTYFKHEHPEDYNVLNSLYQVKWTPPTY